MTHKITKHFIFRHGLTLFTFYLSSFLIACATPAPVKQAVKEQSGSYIKLLTTIQDFHDGYLRLRNQVDQLIPESNARIEMVALTEVLTGEAEIPENVPKNTLAHSKFSSIQKISKTFDAVPANRREMLKAYQDTIKIIEQALANSQEKSKKTKEETDKSQKTATKSIHNLKVQIQALMVIHDTIAEYLNIDLTPNAKLMQEIITNSKEL